LAKSRGAQLTEVFAHRGSAQLARENTVAAFVAARALGADGIELDVHLTADGVLAVHHDPTLPGRGRISELTSDELPDWLPSLAQALDASRPLQVNIELKSEPENWTASDDLLAAKVAELAVSREESDRLVVSSFSLQAIDAVRAAAPQVATALLIGPAEFALDALATAHDHGHLGLHPFYLAVDEPLVSAAKALLMAIRPWTVDDPRFIVALAGMGVDAVITNDVAAALKALGRP
jgi:glycerophosphoryl diester phosphodiesterase